MDALTFQTEARRNEKLLYRIAYSYLRNNEDAEDAMQEALIKAWEKRDTLRDENLFRPWLARITANQCTSMLRKSRKWRFLPLDEATAQVEMPEVETPVLEAMKTLKPEVRLVMTLHYVDGYQVQEIADMLGMPSGTVKTRMRSGRKQMGRTLRIEWEQNV